MTKEPISHWLSVGLRYFYISYWSPLQSDPWTSSGCQTKGEVNSWEGYRGALLGTYVLAISVCCTYKLRTSRSSQKLCIKSEDSWQLCHKIHMPLPSRSQQVTSVLAHPLKLRNKWYQTTNACFAASCYCHSCLMPGAPFKLHVYPWTIHGWVGPVSIIYSFLSILYSYFLRENTSLGVA